MKKLLLVACLTTFSIASYAGAPWVAPIVTGTGSSKVSDNRAYVGLKWTMGKGTQPDVVVGVRNATVKSSGDVSGGDVSVVINTKSSVELSKIRLKYFDGRESVQGEISSGYDFKKGIFVGLSGKSPYANLGVDMFGLDKKSLESYVGVDSLKKYSRPDGTQTLTCPDGRDWFGLGPITAGEASCNYAPSDYRLKDHIQYIATLSNGLKLYSFKYKSREGNFVGVMAQDLLANPKWSKAVVQRKDGYYMVNYGMLGINMVTLENWYKNGKSAILISKSKSNS
jgi:hypothetical protein